MLSLASPYLSDDIEFLEESEMQWRKLLNLHYLLMAHKPDKASIYKGNTLIDIYLINYALGGGLTCNHVYHVAAFQTNILHVKWYFKVALNTNLKS